MALRALLVAPPGAGKGTQAARISAHFEVPSISTGDLFRQHVALQDELGRTVQAYVEAGDLVPDDVVLEVVQQAVGDAMAEFGGYLLDGFPRNLNQARRGYHIATGLGATVHAVLHYEVSQEELMRRLLARSEREGRPDDNPQTIRHRLDVFRTETVPLLDYYGGRGVLITIPGERPVDEVTADSITALERVLSAAEA